MQVYAESLEINEGRKVVRKGEEENETEMNLTRIAYAFENWLGL